MRILNQWFNKISSISSAKSNSIVGPHSAEQKHTSSPGKANGFVSTFTGAFKSLTSRNVEKQDTPAVHNQLAKKLDDVLNDEYNDMPPMEALAILKEAHKRNPHSYGNTLKNKRDEIMKKQLYLAKHSPDKKVLDAALTRIEKIKKQKLDEF